MQIRDVDPVVRDRLKRRAADQGLSLNAYLKELLARDASRPRRAEVVSRLVGRGDVLSAGPDPSDTAEMIRAMREERTDELLRRMGYEP